MLTGRARLSRVVALAAMVVLACACGATPTSGSTTSAPPGQGKPTIVLGDQGTAEQALLGELYAQAFRSLGYVVVLEPNAGDAQHIDAALQAGTINAYPADLGELAATDAGHTAPLASETEAEQIAQQYEGAHGGTVMAPVTPFSNAGVAVTLESFAKQRNVTTIDQLKALPFRLKFGDYAARQSQYAGYAGIVQAYGVGNLQFVALAADSSIYDALDTHLVQLGVGLATDPQLALGTYSILGDPKNVFGFHHVALVIDTSLLDRLGPQFKQIYTSVTGLLTLTAVQGLLKSVVLGGQVPASVAHSFLLANGLVTS